MSVVPFRDPDGRFSTKPARDLCSFDQAYVAYHSYLAAVCAHQDMSLRELGRQLARSGRPNSDVAWRRATYARQLALYLTNTTLCVPQNWLADIANLTRAAVHYALQSIEDLRDHGDYDTRVDMLAAVMGAHGQVIGWSDDLSDRSDRARQSMGAPA